VKKQVMAVLAAGLLATQVAWAEMKIAVMDANTAVLSSEIAKEKIAQIKKDLSADEKAITDLGKEIQTLQTKLEQDSAVMSDTEKKNVQREIEEKANTYQFKLNNYQTAAEEAQQKMLNELTPILQQAVTAVLEEGGYDLVVQRSAVIYAKDEYVITKQVTEKINAAQ